MNEEIDYSEILLMVDNLVEFYDQLDTIEDYFI